MKQLLLKTMLLTTLLMGGNLAASAADKWVKTAPANLATGDVVVIVDQTSSTALPNTAVSKAPAATAITLNADKSEISGTVTSTLEWVVTIGGTNDARIYQFSAESNNNTYYLGVKADNNGVYVATTAATGGTLTFTISQNNDNVDYLSGAVTKNSSAETRYIGVYTTNNEWRCYTSMTATNIKNTVTAFYKKVPAEAVDLTSFAFDSATPSVNLMRQNGKYEASYTQAVGFEPDTYNGAITYGIDYEDVNTTLTNEEATINSGTGAIAISLSTNKSGTIVVKANGAATDDFKAAEANYTLTVNAAEVGAPVFTPAAGEYYYGQIITVSALNAAYINYTADESDPDDSSDSFPDEGYELTGNVTLKAIAFDDDLNESDIITAAYTVKAPEAPTFSVAAGSVTKGTTVTLNVGEGGSTVIYTTDGTTPSYANNIGDIYTDPIVINYGQTIKAISVDGGENESTVAEATYTLIIPTGGTYYTLVTDASQLVDGAKILIASEESEGSVDVLGTTGTTSSNNNRAARSADVANGKISTLPEGTQVIELEASGDYWYLKVGNDSYLYASSGSSNQLKAASKTTVGNNGKAEITLEDNGSFTVEFQGTNSRNNLCYNYNNGTPLFSCYASDKRQADVYFYIEQTDIPTEELTVQSYGWATYIPSYAVEFPANRAYVVTDVTTAGKVTVEGVTKVPARTPVLLKGEGTVTATIINETVTAPTTNMLSIGTGTTPEGKFPYVLAKDGDKAGFKLWTGVGSVLKDRVVLLLNNEVSAARSFFFLDDKATGINTTPANNERVNSDAYDLQGRRVAQPVKGLYIVNGKKVLVK